MSPSERALINQAKIHAFEANELKAKINKLQSKLYKINTKAKRCENLANQSIRDRLAKQHTKEAKEAKKQAKNASILSRRELFEGNPNKLSKDALAKLQFLTTPKGR